MRDDRVLKGPLGCSLRSSVGTTPLTSSVVLHYASVALLACSIHELGHFPRKTAIREYVFAVNRIHGNDRVCSHH